MSKSPIDEAQNNVFDLKGIGLITINELNTHPELETFYVASYQRGYRWGKEEIEYLLNDINSIAPNMKYCIQPLSVTNKSNKIWELIDGQQRTTTIFLIQSVFKNFFSQPSETYSIDYNTRKSTGDFLKDIRENSLSEFLESSLDDEWSNYLKNKDNIDNIDNYHLFKAYLIIYKWLIKLNHEERLAFYEKLRFNTYVIWHPVSIDDENTQKVEDFFINMNAGKIKLTSAELIKAIFIIDIEKSDEAWDVRDFNKKKLANEWDQIENELHNNTFWHFINDNHKREYPTRIGKLFDIDCNRPKNGSEMYSYFEYVKKDNLDWDRIKQIFRRLKEWYDDVESYHLIGFIINSRFKSLEDIISETKNKSKTEIKRYFSKTIKENFNIERKINGVSYKVYSLDNLRYDKSYQECKNTLLLYNIKLIEKTFPNQRFPFDLYQKPDTEWSIEHIHPQNPQLIKTVDEAFEWLSDYEERFKEEDSENENIDKIKDLHVELKNCQNKTLPKDLSDKMKEFSDAVSDTLGLHQIGNQALLDKVTNSKIGNKSFLKKRNLILNESETPEDSYIPLSTINNFLKKTTETGGDYRIKVNYWSTKDAEDYTEHIEKLLKNYLPENRN